MGEKIKVLSEGEILNTNFEIELNHPPRVNQEQQIHIQSDNLRLEFDKSEFVEYSLLILLAEKNLLRLKNII
jgi:hypothetical protein